MLDQALDSNRDRLVHLVAYYSSGERARHVKRGGKIWIRIFPDKPISKKPLEVRQGKGKGNVEYWVAQIQPGRMLYEMEGVSEVVAREAFRLAAAKLPLATTFVATLKGRLVGVGSYIQLDERHAETASLAVDPEFLGCGIGYRLHEARVVEMRRRGIRHLRTESDRPAVIHWYTSKFGYRIVGKNPKKHDFGWSGADVWTILEVELD